MSRIATVLVLLVATLVAPFWLRPDSAPIDTAVPMGKKERLVVITPHNETIRAEFGQAFERHMRETHGQSVEIDWRIPGGTSEIALFLRSEFENAFRNHWEDDLGERFTPAIAKAWRTATAEPPGKARTAFLESDVGIGIDLFFGGGPYDFDIQSEIGILVPNELPQRHPDWFTDAVIPATVSGEPFYDPEFRWIGTCLSTFGICYNTDVLARRGLSEPRQWADLADPRYVGQVALADPTKSGSATKAFEMLIQQQMRQALEANPEKGVEVAVAEGWKNALQLILQISANARYFTDSATKVPHDVASGDAAAGMCIDFYGRTYSQLLSDPETGESRIEFEAPVGGTSVAVDPVGLIRGAPNRELAHQFMEFVLSRKGQTIWNFRTDEVNFAKGLGPQRTALRRLPVRKDLYTPEYLEFFTDPDALPFENANAFTYEPDWTGKVFSPLRFIIRVACVDVHTEQKAAWEVMREAGFPAEAMEVFLNVDKITMEEALGTIRPAQKSKDKIDVINLARDLTIHFRNQYARAAELADTTK